MSGAVFHEGHHELHGITVVVDCSDGRTLIGRFDREQDGKVVLLNASVNPDPAARGEFVSRAYQFGVRPDESRLLLDASLITRLIRLSEASRRASRCAPRPRE